MKKRIAESVNGLCSNIMDCQEVDKKIGISEQEFLRIMGHLADCNHAVREE